MHQPEAPELRRRTWIAEYPLHFKAAILEEIGQPLVLDTVEFRGPLTIGQILVQLSHSGICGKQTDEIDGRAPDPFLPHLLGHEGSGWVVDIGPGVTKVNVGENVVMHWLRGSGIQSDTPHYFRDSVKVNAGWVTTFNEYAVVSENRVTRIPNDSDMVVAALLGCVVTTGVGIIVNKAQVQPHDDVVIFGCGGVGLCAVQAVHMRHARKLIAVDVNQRALDLAGRFGATEVLNPQNDDVVSQIRDMTSGIGATKVLVCTGDPRAIEEAVEATAIPGECFILGVPQKGSRVKIDPWAVMHERTIRGSLGGDSFPDRDIPAYFDLHKKGHLKLDQLVSHVGDFANLNEAITLMRGDTPGRCLVKF